MPEIPRLDYAPPPPMHRRRVFRRWVYATVLLGVALSGWWWAPPAWRRAELLYWQHECMVYVPPPDQIVYDDSDILSRHDVIPEAWRKFYSLLSPPGFQSNGTAFLHEMKTPDGQRCLVAFDITFLPQPRTGVTSAMIRVFSPGGLFEQPVEKKDQGHFVFSRQVFAGTLDPGDPTHFIIRTRHGDDIDFYDGWLQNDQTVSFGMRVTATTHAAPDVHPGLQNP